MPAPAQNNASSGSKSAGGDLLDLLGGLDVGGGGGSNGATVPPAGGLLLDGLGGLNNGTGESRWDFFYVCLVW